jgi:hypothetical protein
MPDLIFADDEVIAYWDEAAGEWKDPPWVDPCETLTETQRHLVEVDLPL